MVNLKTIESILEWIEVKEDQNWDKNNQNDMMEHCQLSLIVFRGSWFIELNETIIISDDDLEWDDINDTQIPIEITLEKKYQEYVTKLKSLK